MSAMGPGGYKRVFSVLFGLTKKVNQGVPLPELLREVARSSTELVGANTCSIMLLDEARMELISKAAWGLTPEEEEKITFRVGEGVAGWTAEHGAPALIHDVLDDARFKAVEGQPTAMRSMLAVPLTTKEGVIGVICATSQKVGIFGKEHEELLGFLGGSIVKDLENARLYRLSITDSLTKAFNRQYLYQRLPSEIERCKRYGDTLSVVLFDIDSFKVFNDTFGHPAGDFVLKELVRLGQGQIRAEVDALVRWGGEEFLLMLPNTPLEGAVITAERLRARIEAAQFPWSDRTLRITISSGVSLLLDEEQPDEGLLRRADQALYKAKQGGRNRVEVCDSNR